MFSYFESVFVCCCIPEANQAEFKNMSSVRDSEQ